MVLAAVAIAGLGLRAYGSWYRPWSSLHAASNQTAALIGSAPLTVVDSGDRRCSRACVPTVTAVYPTATPEGESCDQTVAAIQHAGVEITDRVDDGSCLLAGHLLSDPSIDVTACPGNCHPTTGTSPHRSTIEIRLTRRPTT